LIFLGVEKNDTLLQAEKLAQRVLNYRIFNDTQHKMNINVQALSGEILVVPQFTLTADTQSGLRPSFAPSASPKIAALRYQQFIKTLQQSPLKIAMGQFGANMAVSLTNDGPVTILIDSKDRK
jgi:D-tyrosyl-tRNA(Tyr) deacylase